MQHRYKLIITVFFIFSIFIWGCPDNGTAEERVAWQNYETGIEKVEKNGKKGFLHFYTDWCTYCKLMVKKTFSDAKVRRYLNNHFVPMRVNAEEKKDVAKQYGVSRFPSTWFLSEEAENIGNRPGFIPPDLMLSMLKYINSDSYKEMKFQQYMDNQQ